MVFVTQLERELLLKANEEVEHMLMWGSAAISQQEIRSNYLGKCLARGLSDGIITRKQYDDVAKLLLTKDDETMNLASMIMFDKYGLPNNLVD